MVYANYTSTGGKAILIDAAFTKEKNSMAVAIFRENNASLTQPHWADASSDILEDCVSGRQIVMWLTQHHIGPDEFCQSASRGWQRNTNVSFPKNRTRMVFYVFLPGLLGQFLNAKTIFW